MYMIKLGLVAQRRFKKNILTRVISQSGPDHCPTIEVDIELPNGVTYKGKGVSKAAAKELLAKKILREEFGIND